MTAYLADWLCGQLGELTGHPALSGALRGGRPGAALASGQYGVKVEVDAVCHEVTVDDVVHVTIQVFGEHVNVQVCGQPVVAGREAGRRSKRTHSQQAQAGIG